MRIARGEQIIGDWSLAEINRRIASADLLPTDSFYDEDTSDWRPLADLEAKLSASKVVKGPRPPCYCGSGLAFRVCCGLEANY